MEELTALQWAKIGYIPNTESKGVERWTNSFHSMKAIYYKEDEVHEDSEAAKAILKSKQKEYREESKKRKKKLAKFEVYRENMKTEWQWLQEGRMPNSDARWENGESLNKTFNTCSFGSRYCYCHKNETFEASNEELQIAVKKYDKNQ